MKKEFLQNPDNRYRVVTYFPTVEQIKEDYTKMFSNYKGGYLSVFDRFMKTKRYSSINDLLNNPFDFWKVIKIVSQSNGNRNCYFGLQENNTGTLIRGFYSKVYSYHPDQGYVIFQKEHDRDFGCEYTFNIVSLKTSKEIENDLVEHVSGIDNLTLLAVESTSSIDCPCVFKISVDEELVIDPYNYNSIPFKLPYPNGDEINDFGIEHVKNGIPFFEEPEFLNAAFVVPDLMMLVPKRVLV